MTQENTSLTNLSGLDKLTSVGGNLSIQKNAVLIYLSGLSQLTSIGKSLSIQTNAMLIDLSALAKLTSVGDIEITDNVALTNLCGIQPLLQTGFNTYTVSGNAYNPTQAQTNDATTCKK